MCTLLFAFRCHPLAPLVVAANRDELYARPTRAAMRLAETPHVILGGQDVEKGGTWLGLRDDGFFVGLTNLRSWAPRRASRGELVMEALFAGDVDDVDDLLRRGAAHAEYRPFNLLYGNGERLHVAHVTDAGLAVDDVEPGLHVLPSGGRLDDPGVPKVGRGLRLLTEALTRQTEAPLVAALLELLADHALPPADSLPAHAPGGPVAPEMERQLQALCVHTPSYGTRSAAVLLVGGAETRYYYVDGKPCQHEARRVDDLFAPDGQVG